MSPPLVRKWRGGNLIGGHLRLLTVHRNCAGIFRLRMAGCDNVRLQEATLNATNHISKGN